MPARLGHALSRVYPGLDARYWTLGRQRHVRASRSRLSGQVGRLRAAGSTRERPPHLVVVADQSPASPTWTVAGGNLFFEVYQSAIEALGPESVTLFWAEPDEPECSWHGRLLEVIHQTAATHLVAQIESDPNQNLNWSWDVVADALADSWDGAFIGVMFDSAYAWLQTKARRLGRILPSLLIADICVPMDGFVRPGRYEVGPMTMPLSQASVAAIDAYVADLPKVRDVTFIGTLYEYRVELLEPLKAMGLEVAINPHRPEAPQDQESSVARSTYLDYMAALAQSELTINYSLARGGPMEQYKIRIQEASLVGCLCLTDDTDATRHFFSEDEYAYFADAGHMDGVVADVLADRGWLAERQRLARQRAHELARTDFWGRIEVGLTRRGMARLTGLLPPAEPA